MRLRTLVVAALLAVPVSAPPSHAAPPAGSISKGVTFLANIPELRTAISLNFIGSTMFASTVTGIFAYDVSKPAAPRLVGALPQYIWENEDVDVDAKRHLLFLSRDPRGFTSPATTAFPYGAVQVIDVKNPALMTQLSITLLPSGHTTTCVDHCRYTWTAGPAASPLGPSDWAGRPVFALDMRDPAHPVACPHAIDEHRNDGVTDYTHDVQVDSRGIAWVSGSGGVRGYWVSGRHKDAATGRVRVATGCNPVPYGGGGTDLGQLKTRGGVMHNSLRRGDALVVTEEVTGASSCAGFGRLATYSLKNTYAGAGFRSSKAHPFRMKVLDTWTPEKQAGSSGCDSAHYFTDRGDGVLAMAFYAQGTRFLDVRNPADIRQVGFYRPDDANTWAAYWRPGGFVFVADLVRGVDVLKVGALQNKVTAPALVSRPSANEPDPVWRWMCQVPPTSLHDRRAAARPLLAQDPAR
jgi:hypothetical protein